MTVKKLWITLLLVLCCFPAAAESGNAENRSAEHRCGDYAYTLNPDGSATLTDWLWEDLQTIPDTLYLPAELDGHPVTALGDCALLTEGGLDDPLIVVIPEGVARFEGDPFACCHEARKIVFPSTLTEVPEACFLHVEADVEVAPDNPALTVRDGCLIDTRTSTLLYCAASVADAPIPAVRRIGDGALANWGWAAGEVLTLTIPEGVESIGRNVIFDSVHISRLILPDSLTEMAPMAFDCTALTQVEFGSGLTRLPEGAFLTSWDLRGVVLPENIVFVGCEAFYLPEGEVTALNPDCHFETPAEYLLRLGEDADPMIGDWYDWLGE